MTAQDQWSKWLLETRFGGNAEAAERAMARLRGIRDRVLDAARITEGETVLDVGCGDGLIAFGALERAGESGQVIFSDISAPLLDHCRKLASDITSTDRCTFVEASADDLGAIADGSVDVVTTRSVLIYVKDKRAAFEEFHRVLRPSGRLSIFEPINRFESTYAPQGDPLGVAGTPAAPLAARIRAHYQALQPPDTDPMLDFDEIDLVRLAEQAGFTRIRLDHIVEITTAPPMPWDVAINVAGNPRIPTLAAVMAELFSHEEMASFEAHVRPRIEAGGSAARSSHAYLFARKWGPDTEEAET